LKSPNFSFLSQYEQLLYRSAAQAELYLFTDPNIALIKLRQFAELLAQEIAARSGAVLFDDDRQIDILRRIQAQGVLPSKTAQLFHSLRKTGNQAVHEMTGDKGTALYHLRMARELAIWFHKSFGNDPGFKAGAFIPPPAPMDAEQELRQEIEALRLKVASAEKQSKDTVARQRQAEQQARAMYEELAAAMSLAEETEEQLTFQKKQHEKHLQSLRARLSARPEQISFIREKTRQADDEIDLDEAATRQLIDEQLCDAGWQADTRKLTCSKGIRPQKGKNTAIAEWPTGSGPADYVLFKGLTAIAVVEAKRKRKDVAGAIDQAKRYSRDFKQGSGCSSAGGPWGDYQIPFLFATNGRPYLRQIETKSGIWFLDGRKSTNHPKALVDWYTPEGLQGLLAQNIEVAEQKLSREPTEYLGLRDYQIKAIHAVEDAIAKGKTTAMLAMATGTGKTRTCIGLCYRLLKAGRFRRILFLVDRTSLGEQAAGAFNEVKLENLQSFSDIYDIKELGDITPDSDTRLHMATIQGMIRRLLYGKEDTRPLPIDQYDCIVIDECHRGYSLDQEMTEGELLFRGEQDYISKYTRVLDHFDAVKVGLTATPALHTTEIFGPPVYTYSYRQAVIDGFLIDHEPPFRILTKLVKEGMQWKHGEKMNVYHTKTARVETFRLEDEVNIEVGKYNTKVITESFNKVVCAELAKHIEPSLPGKTLIFCANDAHADMVVRLLKDAFAEQYGEVDDDAVVKITAAADKPLEKIRHYKNEKLPSVAVTVDLLTTGIDVPEIVNLVFIRRVRSRILYEQMIGRATRLCDEIGKDYFRIFDTVDLYDALEDYSTMKPVVVSPTITFTQLAEELARVTDEEHLLEIKDQIIAKLQRKKRLITGTHLDEFQLVANTDSADHTLQELKKCSGGEAASWFAARPHLAVFLDRLKAPGDPTLIISDHNDQVVEVAHGYGEHEKPQDYLQSFTEYIKANINTIAALKIVTTRPRDLTRKELRELKLILDREGYSETALRTAWKDATNQEIAASIIGFIRQSALGSPLLSYRERVDRAMKTIMTSHAWTVPQRKWLERIGKQLLQETIVDREALNSGQFKALGGFTRLNKIFDGRMEDILGEICEQLWLDTA
jgi:type I restriction enzyme R subunit